MTENEARVDRRTVLAGAGIALSATAIAGCATYGKPPAPSPSAGPSTSGAAGQPPSTDFGNALVKTSAVPVGSGVIVGETVITQPAAGTFKGMSAICTHQGCTVSEIADGSIICPCHGSKFALDGSVQEGPAKKPLPARVIKVSGDSIVVQAT
ncbi:(2Fe-2S)-binding protein [Mycobacterium sp. ST-F2]|uniref:QcrA and Rieske domain-containing protein n=1 Tax=Mycobacterium sp. ST-F2 TaxID=1490484 RepID=UPI00093E940D|nr:Rieske (2Fe-2S) protein [Mycobacterium sp. ST-F2]OKH76711.1 (2Fe-2S)-binding protein [Mycobacterium sp. ST-F2]